MADISDIKFSDLKDLEAELGRPIGALFAAVTSGEGFDQLDLDSWVGLLWLVMRVDRPEVQYKEVFSMNLGELGKMVTGGPESPLVQSSGEPTP